MKVFALCVVKNEKDIIAYNLTETSKWAEKVFVLDNGSDDSTWEIINKSAANNPKIIPWKTDPKPFRDEVRAEIFNEFRHYANDGDWWCFRMDADEFYIDNPVEFLSKVPKNYHVVQTERFDYYLTHEDLNEFEFKDDDLFNPEKLKYYNPVAYCEKRFFKHRNRLEWPFNLGHPTHMGIVYPKKIRQKHYQYRSPQQIQIRLDIRRKLVEAGMTFFRHASQQDWKEKLKHRSELVKDMDDGNWVMTGIRHDLKRHPLVNFALKIAHRTGIFP